MLKTRINVNKILSKIIKIPNIENTATLSIPIFDAITLAENNFKKNYYDYSTVILERVIEAAPKFTPPYLALSMILQRLGNKITARNLVMQALSLEPTNIRVLAEASSFFSLLYEHDRSYELILKAYKLAPTNSAIINQYAGALLRRNRKDDAITLFKKALSIDCRMGIAYQNLAFTDINQIDNEMLDRMTSILASLKKGDLSRVPLLFAAAKKYAKLGQLDMEFTFLDEANALIRQNSSWTWQYELSEWRSIEKRFTKEFVNKIQRTDSCGFKPIILATLPRSGTTLIEMILSSHTDVCAAGESHLFHGPAIEQARHLLGDYRYFNHINESNAANYLEAIVKRSKEIMAEQGLEKPFVTDKTTHNYYSLGVILSAFPEAKVLHIEREPLDICLSCYQLHFSDGSEYTFSLSDTARICNIFDAAMKHWKSIFPDRIHTVKYEDLVADPEKITQDMLAFCDLEWQEQCLRFYERDAIVNTASLQQVKSPINKSGLARWKKYEVYLQPAIEALNKGLEE